MSDPTRLDLPSLSFTSPTPIPSPIVPQDEPGIPNSLQTPPRPSSSGSSTKGKRKANEIEGGNTPPDAKKEREQKATFAVGPRPLRQSNTTNSSQAPSSFHRQKRARLSTPTESRPGSRSAQEPSADTAATVGSWSSRKSILRPPSRGAQSISQQSKTASLHRAPSRRSISRRSISQSSIPISALISPHAPSIARSGTSAYHMRDPHKPPRIQPTVWSLSMGSLEGSGPDRWRRWTESGGSPLHAWLFFLGFVLFPVWWVAAFLRVLRTRRIGKEAQEAQVVLDDPQLEFDARTWRTRCRIMAAVSIVTYVPFVVLVAVFARRR
ncbi:WD-REPEATS-REGION domain-containing protein [Mycena sanguinolenta]|uniref:WD-REPEATS-REGION domain-containing protein n=1 Tax=Mycena sanguinolenta TaxID=230812 RepID=A0A8H6YXZ3_9AGAR|nr:WD-REPEATS-REGION domain-containing protein [Mycena sanguinolenta]